jgi:hypothetical protein
MKRSAGLLVLLAGLGGCMSASERTDPALNNFGRIGHAQTVPGVQMPDGTPVPVRTARGANPAGDAGLIHAVARGGKSSGQIKQVSGIGGAGCSSPGCSGHQPLPTQYVPVLPQGGIPPVPAMGPPGAVAAVGALTGAPPGGLGMVSGPLNARSEVRFIGPEGMEISWLVPSPKGGAMFSPNALVAPARYNFPQGAVYRLKLSNIPRRAPAAFYPTIEIMPAGPKSATFLAHSAIPLRFTEEDFDQVANGNFLVKVIYLPDPQFQDIAAVGLGEIVSSQLEPGVDPIHEAQQRGTILMVVRMGNIDLEAPNTPAMDAPPGAGVPGLPPGAVPVNPPQRPNGPAPMPAPMQSSPSLPPQTLPLTPAVPATPAAPANPTPTRTGPLQLPSSLPGSLSGR